MEFFESIGNIISRYWLDILKGAGTTLWVSLVGTLFGLLIGLLIGTVRTIPTPRNKFLIVLQKILNWLLSAYVEIFRGTPMMVQAVIIYWGFANAMAGKTMDTNFTAVMIVSINTGAYITEIVRGGINSIDKGQWEGAYAIGMRHSQAMLSVILPQTIKNILPATSNEFVVNIKDTSVLMILPGFVELFRAGEDIIATTYQDFATYTIVCVMYFILTFSITRVLRLIERKLNGKANYKLYNTDLIGKGDNGGQHNG